MPKLYSRLLLLTSVSIALFVLWGCNAINPKEKIPTYVHIDSFIFEGNTSHEIKHIWVYYNNNPVGAFDLPATIPIITSGATGSLEIAPGISINGRNERPLTYPFYKIDVSTLNEQPGKIVYYTPKTKYFDSVKFRTISEFEAGITKFSRWGGTTNIIGVTADSLTYEGTGSGAVFLVSAADSSIDSTTTPFVIKPGAAFIEFDYNTTVPFILGIQANLGSLYSSNINYLAGVLPNTGWKKFYLNLSGFVNQYPADNYHLYIKTSMPAGQTNGRMLIDNVKLVTF